MLTETINGFVLQKPIFDPKQITYTFAATKKTLALNAVSLQSLIRNVQEDCEVLFLTKDLDETDLKRIKEIADKNRHIRLSVFSLTPDIKLPYVNLSLFSLDTDICFFIPFILKRYENIVHIKGGTIVKSPLQAGLKEDTSIVDCYVDEKGEVVAIGYHLEAYVNQVTIKHIHQTLTTSMADNDVELFKELCDGRIYIENQSCFINGRIGDGYTDSFLKYAKDTFFYEKLLFSHMKGDRGEKKPFSTRYLFPYELIEKGKKIIIYGAGAVGTHYLQQMQITDYCKVVMMVDRNCKVYQRRGDDVQALENIKNSDYDYIVIANANAKIVDNIRNNLLEMGIDEYKIISPYNREWKSL